MRAGGKEERCCGDPQVSRSTVPGGRPWGGGGAPRARWHGARGEGQATAWVPLGGPGSARPNAGGYGPDGPSWHSPTTASLIASAPAWGPGGVWWRDGGCVLPGARGSRWAGAPRCRPGGSGAAGQPPHPGSAAPGLCPGTLASAKGEGACPSVLKCGPTCPRAGVRAPWQR